MPKRKSDGERIRRILKNVLHVKAYKKQQFQELTDQQKKVRLERAKVLKGLHAANELPNIILSDVKIFIVQQHLNKQNDRVYLTERSYENLSNRLVTRKQAPASVMVWAAVSADFRSPMLFIDKGVKINAAVYREKVLEGVLKPWADRQYNKTSYTFQQDSAPSHKARATQEWLKKQRSSLHFR